MHVAVIDIGKPNKNLGWSMVGPTSAEGTDLDECVKSLASALNEGPLALGFEAPMYVPVRSAPDNLTKARNGECRDGVNRPFSASAGSTVTVTAMVVVPYVLAGLRRLVPAGKATLDWRNFLPEPHGLLLFEAFVTNQRKTTDTRHVEDARLAANHLFERLSSGLAVSSAVDEPSCFSMLGAMMLRTGWSEDPNVVSEECLVVRP
jgi:hypothetical protein